MNEHFSFKMERSTSLVEDLKDYNYVIKNGTHNW